MYLGIDIGTSKAAAVIADDAGDVLAAASRTHGADRPAPASRAEQDAEILLDAAWDAVAGLPADLRAKVRAVGVTGQMHGVAVLDDAGRPLTPLVTWQDGRCLEGPFLEDLAALTGQVLRTGYGCATLAWLAAGGAMPAGAAAAATIHDLAVARLCGAAQPVTDPTDAASWGLFTLRSLRWDAPALAAAGIPAVLLPEVRPCGSRAGEVRREMARRLGIPAGTAVAVALGDNQASLRATLREPEQELALTLGTGGQMSAVLPAGATIDWAAAAPTFEFRPYPGGRYAVVAASLCGGAAWAWLAQTAETWMRDLGVQPPPRDELYLKLNAQGLVAEDTLDVRPHFAGERHAPEPRGTISGIDMTNFRPGAVARGLARGILANLRDMLPAWALVGRTRVVGSGNALRRNVLLQQMAVEVTGLPLVLTPGREEAALGAALIAADLVRAKVR